MQLYEKYRPKTISALVGCSTLKKRLVHLRDHGGLRGRAYWISGKSGTGKTTVAYILSRALADNYAIEECNGGDLVLSGESSDYGRPSILRWERESHSKPIGLKGHWCKIVNEAHAMKPGIVTRLLTTLEMREVQRNMTLFFTTTISGSANFAENFDGGPFRSRTEELSTDIDAAQAAGWLHQIATLEGPNGKPLEDYMKLVSKCNSNLRECLARIGRGEMLG